MILKKDKEAVLQEIYSRASGVVGSQLNNSLHMKVDTGSVTWAFQEAIAKAVAEGFRVLLDNRYTDDDFEKDITLKS